MAKDPAMPFYVNDWLSSPRVQAMTPAQELAYFRLCAFCWASGDASLPDDDDALAAISRMGKAWLKGGSSVVKGCFKQHPTKVGFLTNQRLFDLWSERQEWREKSRVGGQLSAAKRREKSSYKKSKGGSRVVQPHGNSSSSSSSSYISPNGDIKPVGYPADFLRFWQVFPPGRKTKKGDALKAWKRAILRADPEVIIAAAIEYAASDTARGEYVSGPEPWLNANRWEDDRAAWADRPTLATPRQGKLVELTAANWPVEDK